ncbi:MAG: hypothetical protein ACOZDY_18575 [Pseudomonadota bacterium]
MAKKHSTGATITVIHREHTHAAALETLRTSQDRREQYRAFVTGVLSLPDQERDEFIRYLRWILTDRARRRAAR